MNNPFQICIFEDQDALNLTPYQLTRPSFTIPCGFYNLVERIQLMLPNHTVSLLCQKHYEPFLKKRFPKLQVNFLNKSLPTLFINGRSVFSNQSFHDLINSIKSVKDYLFIKNTSVVGVFSTDEQNEATFNLLSTYPSFDQIVSSIRNHSVVEETPMIHIISSWWDYLNHLENNLNNDFQDFPKKSLVEGQLSSFTRLVNEYDMFIHKQSNISDYVLLDASKGPIYISENVTIDPFVQISGPCFIGEHTTIKSHSSISASYIGNHCKVGGEVNRSLIQSYSNKAHHGFLGDSIVGEWVNLGAGTTTSNLKLSYGTIQSIDLNSNEPVETDQQFLGVLFGDFVKTAINSSFDCGSIINSCSSLFGTIPHSKLIPSFTWGSKDHYVNQELDSMIGSITRMMARRDYALSEEETLVIKALHSKSKNLTRA